MSLELAYVAQGTVDLVLANRPHLWDIAPGGLLVEEAGGIVRGFDGEVLFPFADEIAVAVERSDMLAQAFTTGNGHCNFTGPQLLTALAALDRWVATDVAPGAASFPAVLGFIPGFVPPPWPQP